jgi:hypothetical protein
MSPTTVALRGSLRNLMTELYTAQQLVLSSPILDVPELEPLTSYRWFDMGMDGPAMWNWLPSDTSTQADTARRRDSFMIETRIGVNPSAEQEDQWMAMELYVDAYRAVMDPIFRREVGGPLLNGAAKWAERTALANFAQDVSAGTLVGFAFMQRFDLDSIVTPS